MQGAVRVPEDRGLVERLLPKVLLVRRFEEKLLTLFSEGKLNGTVHTCVGQEWSGVAVAEALSPEDTVLSTHRAHGHYLAREENLVGLAAELMGRASGVSGGIGGTQHLSGPNFLSSGIQGGMVPIAVGVALAAKLTQQSSIAVAFIGDGTLGEGILYESLNVAAKWQAPVVVVVENNGYAQSTKSSQTTAGSIEKRAAAFDVRYWNGSTWQWDELLEVAKQAVAYCRREQKPVVLEIETYRLNPHSKGDDNRDGAEIERFRSIDPLDVIGEREPQLFRRIDRDVSARIEAAVEEASRAPLCAYRPPDPFERSPVTWKIGQFPRERHANLIHEGLRRGLESDDRVLVIGEDIEGPYGGAFKVTKDLSLQFPGRVRNTPISEAAIVGIGTGLALKGMLPVVEIMFGDFLTLTFDQLYQHAAKFPAMFNGAWRVPLVVRAPMGGRRGYGPTHSQSIEKFFLGIPGLTVLALNNRYSPSELYGELFRREEGPTLVIENKLLYARLLETTAPEGYVVEFSDEAFPAVQIRPESGRPDLTIVCYGGCLEEVEPAATRLFDEYEVLCEIVCPTRLFPLNITPIAESVSRTHRLLAVEEGPSVGGFGAEVVTRLLEIGVDVRCCRRLGYDGVIPACLPLEKDLLPNTATIVEAGRKMIDEH
jgi:2-oxoisovalerate dehydrogenase E1 component